MKRHNLTFITFIDGVDKTVQMLNFSDKSNFPESNSDICQKNRIFTTVLQTSDMRDNVNIH